MKSGPWLLLLLCAPVFAADDWPQWRHDANRSGATEASCRDQLNLRWHLSLPVPDPAYEHQYRMCADATYAPIAADGLLFVPSNVDDSVTAYELRTGTVRWQFHAQGPVRFAPVYCEGKVFFGADDGFLYCVSASEGRLLWKARGAPEAFPDSRMLVNGRLASRWPVRGGPVEFQGVISFGAGLWPEEGVYVCAVEARSGQVLWRTDALSYVKDGMSDHGAAYDLGLPPQGYLAWIDGKLAVPSGRSLAAWLDPGTGAMEPYTCFYVKLSPPRGTWQVSGIGRYAIQGGNWFGTRPTDQLGLSATDASTKSALSWSRKTPPENEKYVIQNRPFLRADCYELHAENRYTEPVLTPAASYASEFAADRQYLVPRGNTYVKWPVYDRIVARDLTRPEWRSVEISSIKDGRQKVKLARVEFPVRWELKSPLRVLIKAGARLYAGGENVMAAVAIPEPGDQPRIVWQAKVAGQPVNALVADGHLVVTTDRGGVYCFGEGEAEESGSVAVDQEAGPYAPPRSGYALLIGWPGIDGAAGLAERDGYRVVVLEPDPGLIETARAELLKRGLNARQVQVIGGTSGAPVFAPYSANRVVVRKIEALDREPAGAWAAALDLLRPYTGVLEVPADGDKKHVTVLRKLISERTGYTMAEDGGRVVVRRTAPPAGADDWTHEAGGAGNRFASSDRLVKWPLGLLWYSGDTDRFFTPETHYQHERNPFPLVTGGRMFIFTYNRIHAVDIYTGSYLWRTELQETPYLKTRLFDSRKYGRPTERNAVVADDWLYAVTGEQIHACDVATGKLVKVFEIPAALRADAQRPGTEVQRVKAQGYQDSVQPVPQWTDVRLSGELLLAALGPHLVALDRHSGAIRWQRRSTKETTTCALGDGVLYALDCDLPVTGIKPAKSPVEGRLLALATATGRVLWEKPVQYGPVPVVLAPERLWLRPPAPVLAFNPKHKLIVMTANGSDISVFRAGDGDAVWTKSGGRKDNIYGLYPPVVLDDYLLLTHQNACRGFLYDVVSGKQAGTDTGIPNPRTCARVIGNDELLVYRDAATELYDVRANRMVRFNSVRSGCTTSFIPAGGVLTAPMLGHGCVCNYPMFASLALYHTPMLEDLRPAAVKASWTNDLHDRGTVADDNGEE